MCMAHPRRVVKVAKQIEREVGSLLVTDRVVMEAVCPERRRGLDSAISAVASVTEVQLSRDMQVAKVYLSVYSDDAGREQAMIALQRLEGYVRSAVAREVRLRAMPEIRFVADDSIERTERVFKLLEQVKRIESGEEEPPPLAFYTDVVDMGLFEDAAAERRSGSARAAAARRAAAPADAPSGGVAVKPAGKRAGELSSTEVEEMVQFFRQESAGRGKGGGGGRRGGGGSRRG